MRSQTEKIMQQLLEVKNKKSDFPLLHKFANLVRNEYQEYVGDDEFLRMVSIATPYNFLDQLKIGSSAK